MTCKIMQGSSFGGVAKYCMEKYQAEVLSSEGIRDSDYKMAAKDFEQQAKLNARVKKPVMHLALNFHKNDFDNLTSEKMTAIAKEVIKEMGFQNSQHMIIRHFDSNHPHMHIILNRVDNEGKTISDKYCRLRLNNIRKEIELQFPELTAANGKNLERINSKKLKGVDAIKYEIHNAINIEIYNSRDIDDLRKNLEKNHGIKSELKFRSGSITHVDGIKFCAKDTWLTGSKIDKNCSYLNLQKQILKIQIDKMADTRSEVQKPAIKTGVATVIKNVLNTGDYQNGVKKKADWTKDHGISR